MSVRSKSSGGTLARAAGYLLASYCFPIRPMAA